MAIGNLPVGSYKNITASGNIKSGQGAILGFIVATTTSGTLTFYDDVATGTATPITGTITPAAGAYIPLPAAFANGLNVVVGGTINATVIYA